MLYSSSSRQPHCKPGYYHRPMSIDEEKEEETGGLLAMFLPNKGRPHECAICPAGKYIGGGISSFFSASSSSCKSCGKNTFSEKKGSGKCTPCPPHSQSLKAIGSTGCECMDYAIQTSSADKGQGKSLVCKSNKRSNKPSNKQKGTAASKQSFSLSPSSPKSNNKKGNKPKENKPSQYSLFIILILTLTLILPSPYSYPHPNPTPNLSSPSP